MKKTAALFKCVSTWMLQQRIEYSFCKLKADTIAGVFSPNPFRDDAQCGKCVFQACHPRDQSL